MNEVTIQGRILRKYTGRNVIILTLYVESPGPTKEETRVNFPTVLFNRAERKMVDQFDKNDFVNITGTIKVRGIRNEETGRLEYQQFVRGYLVSTVRSEMSEKFNADLGGRFDYINESLIEGEIIDINTRHGVINILINPTDEKFNISLTDFAPNQDSFMRKYTKGTKICVKSEIQTSRKEYEDGRVEFYENIVVSYLDKKREPRKVVPSAPIDDPISALEEE